MITETLLIWLGTVGLLADYVALSRAKDAQTRAVGLAVGLLFYALFTMRAMDYTIWTDAGVQIQGTSMALALVGFIVTAMTFVLLLETGLRALNQ
jgi:hypothetical protein